VIAAIIGVAIFVLFSQERLLWKQGAIVAAVILGIYEMLCSRMLARSAIGRDFKEQVIARIIEDIAPTLHYDSSGTAAIGDFTLPSLYEPNERIECSDMISGMVDDVAVRIADVRCFCDNGKDEIAETVRSFGFAASIAGYILGQNSASFRGIFVRAEFNRKINGICYVIDRDASGVQERRFGESAVMDNAAFEQTFATYTSDQIQARYLLTPRFMEDFLRLRTKLQSPVSAAFLGKWIFVYVQRGRASFEIDLSRPLIGKGGVLGEIEETVRAIIGITSTLRLNDRLFVE